MSVTCTVFGHVAGSAHAHNQGLDFAACHGCGCDLIRSPGRAWTPVPKGFLVVWRTFGRADDARAVAERLRRYAAAPQQPAPRYQPPTRPRRRRAHPGMLGLLRNLRELLAPLEPHDDCESPEAGLRRVICLPGPRTS